MLPADRFTCHAIQMLPADRFTSHAIQMPSNMALKSRRGPHITVILGPGGPKFTVRLGQRGPFKGGPDLL